MHLFTEETEINSKCDETFLLMSSVVRVHTDFTYISQLSADVLHFKIRAYTYISETKILTVLSRVFFKPSIKKTELFLFYLLENQN